VERETMQAIRKARREGRIPCLFRARDVRKALKIDYAGNFLAKHCEGAPNREFHKYFVRVDRGLYRLREDTCKPNDE
jgi:hypothetical protein